MTLATENLPEVSPFETESWMAAPANPAQSRDNNFVASIGSGDTNKLLPFDP
jgi:hypothetical protein